MTARRTIRFAIALIAGGALWGCAGGPSVPDWQVSAVGHVERFTQALLRGDTRVQAREFDLARAEVARTGRPGPVRKVALLGRTSRDTPVSQVMSAPAVTVAPDDTTDACMRLVTDRHVRHLPVLDGGQVVGMVSIGDLVKEIISEQQFMIAQLESYIRS